MYKANFRIVYKFGIYIPQYFNVIFWKDVPFKNNEWDNYSGRFTFKNAEQRLYCHIGSSVVKSGEYSIFQTGKFKNITYYHYVKLPETKKKVLFLHEKYKGKTEFMKNIFPEYFKN